MSSSQPTSIDFYRDQHKRRLSYMPWLYARLKAKHLAWAQAWQEEIQSELQRLETVIIGKHCFIAPEAKLFAEPGRTIIIGDNSFIAADTVMHGPITLGKHVSINHHVTMDGGRKGIMIGDQTRIAAYCSLYAFNHGMAANRPIHEQPVTSEGIVLGQDVWLGAHVGIVDGVSIGDHTIVGMQSVVTRSIASGVIAAGNPARIIGERTRSNINVVDD